MGLKWKKTGSGRMSVKKHMYATWLESKRIEWGLGKKSVTEMYDKGSFVGLMIREVISLSEMKERYPSVEMAKEESPALVPAEDK